MTSSGRLTPSVVAAALVAFVAAGAAASPALIARTSERPPPGHTGGFGEPTCTACHFDYELNEGRGSVRLGGVPEHYVPGRTYTLTVTVADPALRIAGFQLAARFTDGASAGRQAGTLRARRAGAEVVESGQPAVQYARHTDPVIVRADDARRASWTVEWTAPASGGDVVFHVAANAGNDDRSPLGDFIYAREFGARVLGK